MHERGDLHTQQPHCSRLPTHVCHLSEDHVKGSSVAPHVLAYSLLYSLLDKAMAGNALHAVNVSPNHKGPWSSMSWQSGAARDLKVTHGLHGRAEAAHTGASQSTPLAQRRATNNFTPFAISKDGQTLHSRQMGDVDA